MADITDISTSFEADISAIDFETVVVQGELGLLRGQSGMVATRRDVLEKSGNAPWANWLLDLHYELFLDEFGEFMPFAGFHAEFWEWVFSIQQEVAPNPFIAVWPRGAGKSTNVELAVLYLLGEGKRRYCLYCCESQSRADDHVASIEALLETPEVAARYPKLATRSTSKYGASKGWRVSRLHTDSGIIDAVGLDKAVRGSRISDQRPDLIVLDDLDDEHDTPRTVEKKISTLTRAILPAGDRDRLAVMVAQNLIHDDSIVSRLVDGTADFLLNRRVSGPHPAIEGLEYEQGRGGKITITRGVATWSGLSIDVCETLINKGEGLRAFLLERQHKRGIRRGAIWRPEEIEENRWMKDYLPDMKRIYVALDPAASSSPTNSETGIVVAGVSAMPEGVDHGFVLRDLSGHYTTDEWAANSVRLYHEFSANGIVAEKNQGGDMVRYAIHSIDDTVPVTLVTAKRGKVLRAEPVQQLYQQRRVHHDGNNFRELEEQMVAPYDASHPTITFDRMDALVYALWALMLQEDSLPHLDPSRHRVVRPSRRPSREVALERA